MKTIRYFAIALLLALAWTMSGCSTQGGVFGTSTYGTYRFTADRDHCEVSSQTIKGGPIVECVVLPDGGTSLTVKPSTSQVVRDVLEAIK